MTRLPRMVLFAKLTSTVRVNKLAAVKVDQVANSGKSAVCARCAARRGAALGWLPVSARLNRARMGWAGPLGLGGLSARRAPPRRATPCRLEAAAAKHFHSPFVTHIRRLTHFVATSPGRGLHLFLAAKRTFQLEAQFFPQCVFDRWTYPVPPSVAQHEPLSNNPI